MKNCRPIEDYKIRQIFLYALFAQQAEAIGF